MNDSTLQTTKAAGAARTTLRLAPRPSRIRTLPAVPSIEAPQIDVSAAAPSTANDRVASAPLPSDALLCGRKAVEISHNGSVYRLQSTRLGKLILTK